MSGANQLETIGCWARSQVYVVSLMCNWLISSCLRQVQDKIMTILKECGGNVVW